MFTFSVKSFKTSFSLPFCLNTCWEVTRFLKIKLFTLILSNHNYKKVYWLGQRYIVTNNYKFHCSRLSFFPSIEKLVVVVVHYSKVKTKTEIRYSSKQGSYILAFNSSQSSSSADTRPSAAQQSEQIQTNVHSNVHIHTMTAKKDNYKRSYYNGQKQGQTIWKRGGGWVLKDKKGGWG